MTDGVRNSANAMLERKMSAKERRETGFMDRFAGWLGLGVPGGDPKGKGKGIND